MKRKLLILLCAGMMMTGCADKGTGRQEEPEVFLLDLGSDVKEEETDGEQGSAAGSDTDETARPDSSQENQGQEQDSASQDSVENAQNNGALQDLYMQFIDNKVPVIVGGDYPQNDYMIFNLERGRAYTFAELGQYVNQSYFDPEYSEKTSYDYAQYTYVDCLDSDSGNFLVKFVGLNIYSPGDDSFAVYVITEDNGQLCLTDGYECWARSYTGQYRSGLCSDSGSGGAGDHYTGMSAILSNGKKTDIYGAETLSGWWTSYVNEAVYNEVFDANTEVPLTVTIYTIGENKYYTYDLTGCTDDQRKQCETYINRCRDEAGTSWSTDEEVQEAIKKRCTALNMNYNDLEQQEEVKWLQFSPGLCTTLQSP